MVSYWHWHTALWFHRPCTQTHGVYWEHFLKKCNGNVRKHSGQVYKMVALWKRVGKSGCLEHRQPSWIICERNLSESLQNSVQIALECMAVSHQSALELPRKAEDLCAPPHFSVTLLSVHYLHRSVQFLHLVKSLLCKLIFRAAMHILECAIMDTNASEWSC